MFMRLPRTGRMRMPGAMDKEGTSLSTFRNDGLNSGSISYSYASLKYVGSSDIGNLPSVHGRSASDPAAVGDIETASHRAVLYNPCIVAQTPDWVRAWKPAVPGIHEVLHARFVEHAYPPHTHDAWTVFIVDDGAIRYDIERRHRGAAGNRVTILPPHLVHDGRPAHGSGYRKRVIYLSTEVLDERMTGPAVDSPDIEDPSVVQGMHALHRRLADPGETLAAESALAIMTARLLEHLGGRRDDAVERSNEGLASDLRDLLDERRFERITLAEAGRILHASPAHLVRSFSRSFGIAPHRYLLARRVEAARWRLLEGEAVAQVAAAVGFYDQAHLTRHFKRHVGTTPAHYVSRRAR
jgi:AraC-like DNA-binding protein